MNTLILICVLVTLIFGSRMTLKTLSSGSPQNVINNLKRRVESLEKIQDDQTAFVAAWITSLVIGGTITGVALYVLVKLVNLTNIVM